ncbi:putative repeat protein (TIGR03806 family) [Novosphingobium kunmingense]|uniref:Putative repeat protein (TIGR03806 family) n=1 Tax=Novosphingobium kunmingense TaxID=1211806 RepID=A0A2N0I1J5_9SPHN|nr:SO2930 family diheme c-type cytochrome [Novosphingobium kunmingense]PKB25031.1 putative repeat protein (TIGR03806 family) [Novosphingobium kunmingense]
MKLLAAAAAVAALSLAAAATPAPRVNDAAITANGFPAKLSDYGFFADGAGHRPAAGVTPYRVQTPLWSDGTDKSRFVYLPAGTTARAQGEGMLDLPVGAALVKTFALNGKRIETRVLLHRADGWIGLPYVWNAEQTEATLALAGKRIDLVTPAGAAISYAVPNKNQCKECHASGGQVTPIGPKARNLSAEWLRSFHEAGRLDAVPSVARRVPLWEDRAKVPIADAARGWLDANCAHCHKPDGAASNSGLYLGWEVTDAAALGVRKRPVAAGRGAGNLDFAIFPGDPDHSILAYRIASLEGGVAMPELGRASVDPDGLAIVRAWITAMR